MTSIRIADARKHLAELVKRASRGEELVITRHGKPVARLLAPERLQPQHPPHALAERIRHSRTRYALRSGVSMRKLIEEGRR